MNIGILGTGNVGKVIGTRLAGLGHNVRMGSRSSDNPKAAAWAKSVGKTASHGTFADAAKFGEILFNCTSGQGSLAALASIEPADMDDKLLIDLANPLSYATGELSLTVCNTDSLGEQIQRANKQLRVVKALNTMNADVMVHPGIVPGAHDVFICGNDASAKKTVTTILTDWFGWGSVLDLGDISAARGLEMALPLWISLSSRLGTYHFNFHIVK